MHYGISNTRFKKHRIGDPKDSLDRHRVYFNVIDRENAIRFYSDFQRKRVRIGGAKIFLYLVMPEEIFIKHGGNAKRRRLLLHNKSQYGRR